MPNDHDPSVPSLPSDKRNVIDTFLREVRTSGTIVRGTRGRLLFALDATASRQPTWDSACRLQADMFREAAAIGFFYRGRDECRASQWVSQPERLAALMERIDCRTGITQIGKVIAHAKRATQNLKVQALVFVGDAVEEKLEDLCHAAGELGVPAFMFQEGDDPIAEQAFREITRLTHGAYCRFDPGAAHQLAELLRAVAAYAAGGVKALAAVQHSAGAARLLLQLR